MTVSPDWTPPPPPEQAGNGKRPIRTGRVLAGIGIAIAGHLLTILIGWIVSLFYQSPSGGNDTAVLNYLFVAGAGQVILAIAALTVGIILTVKGRDGGVGVGILIGWAIGLIITPVVGFGVCVLVINSGGGGLFG